MLIDAVDMVGFLAVLAVLGVLTLVEGDHAVQAPFLCLLPLPFHPRLPEHLPYLDPVGLKQLLVAN